MNRVKQCIKILLMLLLLLAIIFTPPLYMEYQNNHLLDTVVAFPVQTTHLDYKEDTAQDYNIWERIGIINHSAVVRTLAPTKLKITSTTGEDKTTSVEAFVADKEGTLLLQIMENQLGALINYNVLPALSFSDTSGITIYKETYMDTSFSKDYTNVLDSRLTFSVWVIYAEYPDFSVYAYMDTETAALYDVTVFAKTFDFVYQSGLSKDGFLEYLQAIADIPKEHAETFSAKGSYTERKISLYLSSTNRESKETVYQFNHAVMDNNTGFPLYMISE